MGNSTNATATPARHNEEGIVPPRLSKMRKFIARNLAYLALRVAYPQLFQSAGVNGEVLLLPLVSEEAFPRQVEGPGPHYADLSGARSLSQVGIHLYAGHK
jgi:hypothetical protein